MANHPGSFERYDQLSPSTLRLPSLSRQLVLATLLLQCVVVWSSPSAWEVDGGRYLTAADHSPPFLLSGHDGQPAAGPPPKAPGAPHPVTINRTIDAEYEAPSVARPQVSRYPACPQAPPRLV
ncbi:hypothetical protein GCM10027297_24550 [Parahaliea aestuarii]